MVGKDTSAGMGLLELGELGDTDKTRGLITSSRHFQAESPCARVRMATGHWLGSRSRSLLPVELEHREFACERNHTTRASGKTQCSGVDTIMPTQTQECSL
jgi:hypothetical protein